MSTTMLSGATRDHMNIARSMARRRRCCGCAVAATETYVIFAEKPDDDAEIDRPGRRNSDARGYCGVRRNDPRRVVGQHGLRGQVGAVHRTSLQHVLLHGLSRHSEA